MKATLLLAVALLSVWYPLAAQTADTASPHLARADSLLSAGDRTGARMEYEAVLTADPDNSRALYQLAKALDEGSPLAVRLLRRYTILEPEDAWGFGALAEALTSSGDLAGTVAAYADALTLAPDEREFVRGKAASLHRLGYTAEAVRDYERWIEGHPQDAAAMRQLAELLKYERRTRAAAALLARSLLLEPNPAASERLHTLRIELAPSVESSVRTNRDSDANLVISTRIQLDSNVAEGLRLGVIGGWLQSEDSNLATTSWEGLLHGRWQPVRAGFLESSVGIAGVGGGEPAERSESMPLVRMRARWRPISGPSAELRVRHEPVPATPLLLGMPVLLSEVRGVADIPLSGRLVARAIGRVGKLRAEPDTNFRTGLGGGGVFRLGSDTEVGALYQLTRFAAPTDAPYFAPQQVHALELALYTESHRAWPLTLAIDAGLGAERVTGWGNEVGDWAPAFRLWSLLSWAIRPRHELRLEAEAYETRAGAALAPSRSGWRWGSLGLSLRSAIQ